MQKATEEISVAIKFLEHVCERHGIFLPSVARGLPEFQPLSFFPEFQPLSFLCLHVHIKSGAKGCAYVQEKPTSPILDMQWIVVA